MGRSILAVVAGYVAIFVLIFATFTALYLAIGADRAFRPGTFETSTLWLGLSTILGVVASVVGGLVSVTIAKGQKPVYALAILVVLLGFVSAAFAGKRENPGPRTEGVSNAEAMQKAQQPAWFAWANPVIGAAGVLAGGMLRRPRPGAAST